MAQGMRGADLLPGCRFVATGVTETAVMTKAARRAKEKHDIRQIRPDLAQKVKAAIRTTAP